MQCRQLNNIEYMHRFVSPRPYFIFHAFNFKNLNLNTKIFVEKKAIFKILQSILKKMSQICNLCNLEFKNGNF